MLDFARRAWRVTVGDSLSLEETAAAGGHPDVILKKQRLISPGQFGPTTLGAVINPGAIPINGQINLLCRAEANHVNWLGRVMETRASALWCKLDGCCDVELEKELRYGIDVLSRPEDWRIFQHNDRLFSNHSVYYGKPDDYRCFYAVSEIDLDGGRLLDQKILKLPFPGQVDEKNWVMFSHQGRLLSIYSLDPYIILDVNLSTGETRVALRQTNPKFRFPLQGRRHLSNSTNPVIWDADHYITFAHYTISAPDPRATNRLYLQFAILIDRHTLLPASAIPYPLLTGGASAGVHSGVLYTSSLLVEGDSLYAFHGEGDSHTGVVVFDKIAMNRLFARHPV